MWSECVRREEFRVIVNWRECVCDLNSEKLYAKYRLNIIITVFIADNDAVTFLRERGAA